MHRTVDLEPAEAIPLKAKGRRVGLKWDETGNTSNNRDGRTTSGALQIAFDDFTGVNILRCDRNKLKSSGTLGARKIVECLATHDSIPSRG
jgi:hypothetical protein